MKCKKIICFLSISILVLISAFISISIFFDGKHSETVVLKTISMFGEGDPGSDAYKQLITVFESQYTNITKIGRAHV